MGASASLDVVERNSLGLWELGPDSLVIPLTAHHYVNWVTQK
jgi:hypothetical protein